MRNFAFSLGRNGFGDLKNGFDQKWAQMRILVSGGILSLRRPEPYTPVGGCGFFRGVGTAIALIFHR